MTLRESLKNYGLAGWPIKLGDDDGHCPICRKPIDGSDGFEFSDQGEAPRVYVNQSCDECGSKWELVYSLDFAYIFKDGTAPME